MVAEPIPALIEQLSKFALDASSLKQPLRVLLQRIDFLVLILLPPLPMSLGGVRGALFQILVRGLLQ